MKNALYKIRSALGLIPDYLRMALEYLRIAFDFLRRWRGMCLILAVVILYTLAVWSVCKAVTKPRIYAQAEVYYQKELEAYKAEQQQKAEEVERLEKQEAEKVENVRKKQAEMLAIALYFCRDNNAYDIITACWCFFNRADIQTGEYAYLKTLEDVIAQPNQWMDYDPQHPVLEKLYKIAYEQLTIWLDGGHRPISAEYVFLVWSSREIYLKDRLEDNRATRTWRYTGA